MSTDTLIDEAVSNLAELFRQLKLSDEERQFVDGAATQIAKYAYDLLVSLPDGRASQLRPIVLAAAIASIIGPSDL